MRTSAKSILAMKAVTAVGCLIAAATSLLPAVKAQVATQQADDDATIVGTWSSGSAAVTTGLKFYNPGNNTFNIPSVGGQSYSFTKDGYWEQSLYIFTSDPTHPNCASAQLIWQHGRYTQNDNGTLTLVPFEGDGRQMLQNGCTQQSQTLTSYDQQEFMTGFYVRNDWHFGQGGIYLQMYEFDGTPKPWMWQTHNPPEMLPTQQLHKKIIGKVNG